MTVQELLQKCRDEKYEIIILEEKRDTLRTSLLPKAIQPQKVIVQSSPSNVFDDVQASIYDLNLLIDRRIAEMYRNEEIAFRTICRLNNSNYRQMLTLYYLSERAENGRRSLYKWEQVADKMGYSVQNIYKILEKLRGFFLSEIKV